MNGIYIHIPFCRQACRYCDFYFTVSLRYQEQFVDSLITEIRSRSEPAEISTGSVYLGGGTPSLISDRNLEKIMNAVHKYHRIIPGAEQTIECNPDDLDQEKLNFLKRIGFNRISIGIQSFDDRELSLMRRSHNSEEAVRALKNAAAAGFDNITADLIYGIPGQTRSGWEKNMERMLTFPVNHLSAYHLTFETGTVFDHWRKKGRFKILDEEVSLEMYRLLRKKMTAAGFEHYEISNFASKGFRSQHNLRYWSGESYLGFGPSAHSFDGESRSWNVASLKKYMDGVSGGIPDRTVEDLNLEEFYHDYLITSLRTCSGADPQYIHERFGQKIANHFMSRSKRFLKEGTMRHTGSLIIIDPDRWMLSDHITRDLFL